MHARCKNSAAIETEPSESKYRPASCSVVVDGRARECESFDVSEIALTVLTTVIAMFIEKLRTKL